MNILNKINPINSGISFLANKTKEKIILLISLIYIIIYIDGITFLMFEETLYLYNILMPIFLKVF